MQHLCRNAPGITATCCTKLSSPTDASISLESNFYNGPVGMDLMIHSLDTWAGLSLAPLILSHLRLSLTCAYHVSLAPLILSHLRLSLTCAYHVSLAPRFLSHLRLVDWCGFTHVHTCNVTRVQSATDWTASVHTLHMSTPVM